MANLNAGVFNFDEIRNDLQDRLLQIKIMLWAEDFGNARRAIFEAVRRHAEVIMPALRLKSSLISRYREQPFDSRRKEKIFNGAPLHSAYEDELYVLSPLVNTLAVLDRRVAANLSLSPFIDEKSKNIRVPLHSVPNSQTQIVGDFYVNRRETKTDYWTIKLYRIDFLHIDPRELIRNLDISSGLRFKVIEASHAQEGIQLPISLRALSQNFYSEYIFYDDQRVQITVITDDISAIDTILQFTINAIFHSQRLI